VGSVVWVDPGIEVSSIVVAGVGIDISVGGPDEEVCDGEAQLDSIKNTPTKTQ
jgi:hypothetical protein